MTTRQLGMLLAAGIVLEIGTFHFAYRDLIALSGADGAPGPAVCLTLNRTLDRDSITRDHLERAIVAARTCGDSAAELRALRRLAADHGGEDPDAYLRLGEALRQEGRYEEAAHVFDQALTVSTVSAGRRR